VVLDGIITNPSEWADTDYYDIVLARTWGWPNKQINFSETIVVRYWFKNDATFLYFLARVAWPAGDIDVSDVALIELFWGQYVPPWEHSDVGWVSFGNGTWDAYGWDDTTWYGDIGWALNSTSGEWFPCNATGQRNLAGRASYDGTYYWFELRKALDSGDGYDWSLTPGQTVGDENPAASPNLIVGITDRNDTNHDGILSTYEQEISLYLSPSAPPVLPLSGTWVGQSDANGTCNMTWIESPIPHYRATIISGSGTTNCSVYGDLTGAYNGTSAYSPGMSTDYTEIHCWDFNATGHLYLNTTEYPFFLKGEAFNFQTTSGREIAPGITNSTWTGEMMANGNSWMDNQYLDIVMRGVLEGYIIWNTTDMTWNSFSFDSGTWEGVERVEIPIKGGENATIISNVTITNALVTKNTLLFDASGPSGSTGWINVTFPMINTTEIKVFINQVKLTPPPFPIITTNGTHYFIYFEFTLSTHSIEIQFGPTPVGGISIPVDKFSVLAPYIISAITIILAVSISVAIIKHRKKQ